MKRGRYKKRSLEDRIMAKVKILKNGCWMWTGTVDREDSGGVMKIDGKKFTVRRILWEIHNGRLPDKVRLVARCKKQKCVNPAHIISPKIIEYLDFVKKLTPVPPIEIPDNSEAIRQCRALLRFWAEVSEGNLDVIPDPIKKTLKKLWAIYDDKNSMPSYVVYKDEGRHSILTGI